MSSRKFGTKQLVPLVIAAICLVFLIVGLNKFGFWNDAQKAPTPAFVPSIICTLLIAICLITVFTSQKEDGKAKYHRDEFLIILTFMGPALANFGLKFSPAEMTTLMIMAMTSIGWLLGDDPLRGTISTLVGFVLASIGMDTLTGAPRYNFGSLHLMGGVPFVPFVIGAVGFSQVIGLMMERYNGVEMPKDKLTLRGSLLSKEQFKRLVPPAVRSGVAGTFIGLLPGSGATTASFLGYAMQKGFKSKEPLGTGAIEGVAACESANNAAAAGSFAPLLALGIPGSGTGAVLLGGHVDLLISKPAAASEYVEAGSIQAILALSTERYGGKLADAPTLSEVGDYKDVEVPVWRGVAAPGAMSDEAAAFWSGILKQVSESERWKAEYLDKNMLISNYMDLATTQAYMAQYQADYLASIGK